MPAPFDALSAEEIRASVRTLRASGKLNPASRIAALNLNEPDKNKILQGGAPARQAFAVVYQPEVNRTFEAVIDPAAGRTVSWTPKPGAQPALTGEDSGLSDTILRADSRWQAAMRRRGIVLTRNVTIFCWPAGYFGIAGEDEGRIVRATSYYQGNSNNPYARPIEGVVADINLTTRKVLRFEDRGVVPVSSDTGAYSSSAHASREMAAGPGGAQTARIENGEVAWDHWRFHFAAHPREGLVLHQVRYVDQGRPRSVLYRASLAEMAVPYGDPAPGWFFRNSFDVGELGIGTGLLPFQPGIDCPEGAKLFDAVMPNETGSPQVLPRAIALFERPAGVAWRHDQDFRSSRELVLKIFANLGNYDYGFEWIFRPDGAIEVRVLLTGIMSVKTVGANHAEHAFGHLVGPNLAAIHHQHFFCFRLDFDIDGNQHNRVIELNTKAGASGKSNPYNNAFTSTETLLGTESDARRQVDMNSSRRWVIQNSDSLNELGGPAGYVLLPGENSVPYAAPDSWFRRRAGFLDAHLWVTPYAAAEMYPAGDYPNQSRGKDGLPLWTKQNRSVSDQDLVLWYTLGITHLPRPEDWPVMPVYEAGFKLLPAGFFHRNPLSGP